MHGWLTTSADKAARYADDIYFREAWHQASELLPDPWSVLCSTTYLLIKPETLATRRTELLLQLIRDRGFSVLELHPVMLDRHRVRALWQYQLNGAPLATLAAVDLIALAGPGAIALLAEQPAAHAPGIAASRRLSAMKGSSFQARQPEQLRSLLGADSTVLLSYLHLPDEPADFVRELGIWFDEPARRRIYRLLSDAERVAEPTAAIRDVCSRLKQHSGHADFDLERALADLGTALSPSDQPRLRQLRNLLSDASPPDGSRLELVRWLTDLAAVPMWDRVLIAAHLVRRESPERPALL